MQSVVDVGCGLGDMGNYLLTKDYAGIYLGLDFLKKFIDLSRKKFHGRARFQFQEFDLWKEMIPPGYDYALLSGVFNNRTNQSKEFMLQSIEKMFMACSKGVAFNSMSTYVDYQDEALYYSDPVEIFDYCKKYMTQRVVLRHDYLLKKNTLPYEYTIYLYKDG